MPLWIDEGLSDYMTGVVAPAGPDDRPRRGGGRHHPEDEPSSKDYGGFSNPRLIYNLGHAVFEFIESNWGKEGLRQYLFALRKSGHRRRRRRLRRSVQASRPRNSTSSSRST